MFQKEKHKQKHSNSGIFATRVNITSNKIGPKGSKKDLSRIIYYNCNKKGYYAKTYPGSKKGNAPKDQQQFWQPLYQ